MTPEQRAQALRDRLQQLRQAREVTVHLTDAQRHQQALFLIRYRNNQLRALPSCFGALGD